MALMLLSRMFAWSHIGVDVCGNW